VLDILNTYKQNASFLLFLNNEYTLRWSALTPVNEQLHSPPLNDIWLQWVKKRVGVSIYVKGINQFVTNGVNKLQPFFVWLKQLVLMKPSFLILFDNK
jgi:hypothetical protein